VVVAATGTTTRPRFRQVGYDLAIESEYHQVAILRNAPGMKGNGWACIDSATATYSPCDGLDKFLVGDFYGHRGVHPENFPQNASVESLEELIEHARRRVPKLQNAEIMRGVTGVYDITPDSRPPLRGLSGMGFSRAIGLVMSALLLDGCGKTVDISPFRLSRFAEGLPIKAEYEYKDD
jgi:sarcosine oxidase subunit beta